MQIFISLFLISFHFNFFQLIALLLSTNFSRIKTDLKLVKIRNERRFGQ